jgi:hypothetical protein
VLKCALDPGRAELPCVPRELNDRSQHSATRFRGHIDQRASRRSELLSVSEDQRLSLCVTVRQIRERKRYLEYDVRVARFERARKCPQQSRRTERLEHRVHVVLAVRKVLWKVQGLLAHVRVVQTRVQGVPADVRHDRALGLRRACVDQIFERPERAEAQLGAGRAQEARETRCDALFEKRGS